MITIVFVEWKKERRGNTDYRYGEHIGGSFNPLN